MASLTSAGPFVPFIPAALGLLVPFVGPVIALTSPILGGMLHRRVWPGSDRRTAVMAGIVLVVGLWTTLLLVPGGAFLVIPLCGPGHVLGWLIPSACAIAVYGVVCSMSVRRGNPWLWPLGAVVGAVAFSLAQIALMAAGLRIVC
jgi:hypothetical protein